MTENPEVLVKVEEVSKKFCRDLKKSLWYGVKDVASELNPFRRNADGSDSRLRNGEFWANQGVSFELRRGECLGLIGHNGAGKTTLLKMLNGLIKPDEGSITMRGRVGALIALGAGFNPILTGRENVYVNGAILGLSKAEIDAKFDEIVSFSEIGDFIDAPVQSYSSGMQVRLGFAVASALEPDILLVDEVLAVGDVNFRMKCFKRICELIGSGVSVILVAHSMVDIQRICSRVIVLDRGNIHLDGGSMEGIAAYESLALVRHGGQENFEKLVEREVSLVEAEINGRPIEASGDSVEIETGIDFDVRISFSTKLMIPQARVRLYFESTRGEILSAITTFNQSRPIDLVPAKYQARFEIQKMPLLLGAYGIGISIHGGEFENYLPATRIGGLKIVGPPVVTSGRSASGVFEMNAKAELEAYEEISSPSH